MQKMQTSLKPEIFKFSYETAFLCFYTIPMIDKEFLLFVFKILMFGKNMIDSNFQEMSFNCGTQVLKQGFQNQF